MKRTLNQALTIAMLACALFVACDNSGDVAGKSEKKITAFDFADPAASGVIAEANHVISIPVPFGTDVTALVPTIALTGASVSPASGTAQDFTSPVTYTVTARDGSTQTYAATVLVMAESAKAITSFAFASPAATGTINETDHTIEVTVPNLTNLTALVPTIAHSGASLSPASGTARDFTNPLTYTVRAKNASIQTYTVTVTVTPPVAVRTSPIVGNQALTVYVAGTSIRAGGEATGEIVSPVTERGLCWSTAANPTMAGSHVACGSGYGTFTGDMAGLAENTLYHVRAYVVNGQGTAYGGDITVNSGWKIDGSVKFGGYVFYNDGNGGGMVVANMSDSLANRLPWYNTFFQTGITATAIGAGKNNTVSLLSVLLGTGTAVKYCDTYDDGTYGDWYLPSAEEAHLWFTNLAAKGLGNIQTETYYWTSAEQNDSSGAANAIAALYQSGNFYYAVVQKDASNLVYVRPVRNF
jgi:hypothetical protein